MMKTMDVMTWLVITFGLPCVGYQGTWVSTPPVEAWSLITMPQHSSTRRRPLGYEALTLRQATREVEAAAHSGRFPAPANCGTQGSHALGLSSLAVH